MSNKISVGILLISTWKYNKFIDSTIQEIRQYFFPNSDVKIYLHTDSENKHDADTTIKIEHQPWPLITLNRFNTFCINQEQYDTDYLFYLDVDSHIIDFVKEDILNDFVVVEHHWFNGGKGSVETNPASTACIKKNEPNVYVCGGFFGGSTKRFLSVAKELSNNIDIDRNNNIIALWHDESHLNRYCANHLTDKSMTILPPTYMYSNTNNNKVFPDPKIIPIFDWDKGFKKSEL